MRTTIRMGERLKELRGRSNFTQMNIADFLGVDQSFISKVEKDERVLTRKVGGTVWYAAKRFAI